MQADSLLIPVETLIAIESNKALLLCVLLEQKHKAMTGEEILRESNWLKHWNSQKHKINQQREDKEEQHTCNLTTLPKKFSMWSPPETSFLSNSIRVLKWWWTYMTMHENKILWAYPWMKKSASETHLTLAFAGKRDRNLSQCKIAANPPAEQPERIAYQWKFQTSS